MLKSIHPNHEQRQPLSAPAVDGTPQAIIDQPRRKSSGMTTLHIVADQGHESLVKFLLESGASIDASDDEGLTALHHAAKNGHSRIVKLLLESHAERNSFDHDGLTPLHSAAANGHEEVLRFMLRSGVDPNAKTVERCGV